MTIIADAALKPISAMPSPKGIPILGNTLDFMGVATPWEVLARYARDQGPISRCDIPGASIVMVNDAAAITQILVDDTDSYFKKNPASALRPVSTDKGDVFTQPGGAVWAERKHANPMVLGLKGDWLANVAPVLQTEIGKRIDSWAGQQLEDTYDSLLQMAFDVFSTMLYGAQFGEKGYENWITVANQLDRRMKTKLPFQWPFKFSSAAKAQTELQSQFVGAVREARQNPDKSGTDLLRYSLRNGCTPDDDLLATQLANMYYGGIVSSSTVVAITLFQLTKYESERTKVMAALAALGESPTPEAIESCAQLRGVILEAMRMHPPVGLWTRNVQTDKAAALGGYLLPPGTTVMIGNCYLHRDPAHWEHPDVYLPDRWTTELLAADPLGSAWFFPFGRGERTCLGQDVSMAYISLAVATALTHGTPRSGDGAPLHEDFWFGCMVPRKVQTKFAHPA